MLNSFLTVPSASAPSSCTLSSAYFVGYFIAFTDSEAALEELNAILRNYDVNFSYGRITIIAVEGTTIAKPFTYSISAVTPIAMLSSSSSRGLRSASPDAYAHSPSRKLCTFSSVISP